MDERVVPLYPCDIMGRASFELIPVLSRLLGGNSMPANLPLTLHTILEEYALP